MGFSGVRCGLGVAALVVAGLLAPAAQAATISVVDGTAVFTALPGEVNHVVAQGQPAPEPILAVSDSGAPPVAAGGCTQVDADTVTCPESASATGTLPLVVYAGDRGDDVTVQDSFRSRPVTIYGQDGDDTALVGNHVGSSPTLDGGRGDDELTANMSDNEFPVLRGGPGDDDLFLSHTAGGQASGGDGDDRLRFSGGVLAAPPLRLDGGTGHDTYSYLNRFYAGTMVPGGGVDTLDESDATALSGGDGLVFDMSACPRCVEVVIGSPSGDLITGDKNPQAIFGGDGDDVLAGGRGSDLISGDDGDDTITATDRRVDVVGCNAGTDRVVADWIDAVSPACEVVERS